MATIGHLAVGMATGRAHFGKPRLRELAFFACLAAAPDLDFFAYRLGLPHGSIFGHRGASHSLFTALAVGILAGLVARTLGKPALRLALFAAAAMASHGLLDALTDGGSGVALLWPLTNQRYFAPLRPIHVAPLGMGMFSRRGLLVMLSEGVWAIPIALWAFGQDRGQAPSG